MGTDITCWAERRTVDGWQICMDHGAARDEDGNPYRLSFYCGEERNYALFAILAGVVRMTNQGFEAIAEPRGLPLDSPDYHEFDLEHGAYCHNASWLTLRELLDFPWYEKCREFNGFVDAARYEEFQKQGYPSQCLEGGRVIPNAEMERLIRDGGDMQGLLTLITFRIPYATFAGPFVTETLPLLAQQGEPEDVRIVFYFDS